MFDSQPECTRAIKLLLTYPYSCAIAGACVIGSVFSSISTVVTVLLVYQ